MINTTTAYIDAVYDKIRTSHGRVSFEILDVAALADASLTPSGSESISRVLQLTDKKRALETRFATFEPNLWKLDGSFKILPKSTDPDNLEVGWFSDVISDADGLFAVNPFIQVDFTAPHTSYGITLTFAGEIVSDFDVEFYDALDALIETTSITGNTDRIRSTGVGVSDYQKVKIIFTKTANPYRRVRLLEIDFGVIKTYQDASLIRLNLSEQMNVTSNEVTSNELRFTVDNSAKEFNVTNPTGFYAYLQQKQIVTGEIGIELPDGETEFIPLGKFYLKEWGADSGGMTASFTARDKFDELGGIAAPIGVSGTLYELAEGIMTAAGIEDYWLAPGLADFSSAGFTDKIDCRSALQLIGIASKSAVYQDRYGVLTIKQFENVGELAEYLKYSGQNYAGTFYIEVNKGYQSKRIDLENSFDVPQIKMAEAIKTVQIVTYPSETVYTYQNPSVTNGATIKLENKLINSESHADQIAAWLIDDANARLVYESNWRQNPALECGDIIAVEDGFGQIRTARLLKQEIAYEGYLSGRSQSRGSV